MVKKYNTKFRVGQGGIVEVSSDVTLEEGADQLVIVDASAAPVTVTLQRADGSGGKRFCVKKIDSSANVVTIEARAGQKIDGAGSIPLASQNEFVDLLSDNENWLIVGESMISAAIPHNFLSATHLDTDPATPPATGSLAKGDGANLWAEFVLGGGDRALLVNGAGTNLIYALIKNANVDPTAAIAQSKLAAIALGDLPNLPALGVAPASPRQTDIINDEIAVAAAIAQSKIAGLVAALGTKVDTLADVGVGVGKITKAIVGTAAQFKSILAGAGITVTNLVDEIQIAATVVGVNTFILGYHHTGNFGGGTRFMAFFNTNNADPTESRNQEFLVFAFTIKRMTVRVGTNTRSDATEIVFRKNGADIVATSISIPAATTGSFDTGAISGAVASSDLITNKQVRGAGTGDISDVGVLVECER